MSPKPMTRPPPFAPLAPPAPRRPSPAEIALDVLAARDASPAQIAQRQRQRLATLLQAATATRHYGPLLQGQDLQLLPLASLPVTGKPELMAQFDQRVTDPALALPALRALCADPQRIAEHHLGRYHVWESSGSTGQPGLFVQDDTAMAVYDALEAGRRQSPRPWRRWVDPLFLTERFALVGAIGGHFASVVSAHRLWAANPWLAAASQAFSILQPTAALVAQLNAFKPSIIATYPTAAALLADEARRGALSIRPQEVWTGGETLSPAQRHRIEQGLGCAVRNSYGASEFLPIAWECAQGQLHVNADWVILEPVDAAHRPVADGQVSHTTLLTNLANQVQPLIRFDLGDRIRFDPAPCRCGCALPVVQVSGRRDDVLVVPGRDGEPISLLPLALTTVLEDDAGVFDFQLRQTGPRHWCLTLGPAAPPTPALRARCRQVLAAFAAAQGAVGLHIATRHADVLPLGSSGKCQRVVAMRPAAAPDGGP
jgi:phenylacetate-CoA ligase